MWLLAITSVVNKAPNCSNVTAIPSSLWPPDHRLVAVAVSGVTDPDPGDRVTVNITGVTQDEPTNGRGDGDTSPDAALRGNSVLLRAERAQQGNGRVYQIRFTATDTRGASCTGSVRVGVPPNMKPGTVAIDDGQVYDATRP